MTGDELQKVFDIVACDYLADVINTCEAGEVGKSLAWVMSWRTKVECEDNEKVGHILFEWTGECNE